MRAVDHAENKQNGREKYNKVRETFIRLMCVASS